MKRSFFLVLSALVVLCTAAAQANIKSSYGITIESCVVNQNSNGQTNGINVVYTNTHPESATEVEFLVGYRHHKYKMIDSGTFTTNAQINHNLSNALVNVAWAGPTPNLCTVSRVVLTSGKVLGQ